MRSSARSIAIAVFLSFSTLFLAGDLPAQIVVSGDISPTYDGTSNPWILGQSLVAGNSENALLAISGNGQIFATGGTFGQNNNTASVFLSNPDARIEFSDEARIGDNGIGIFDIRGSATFSSTANVWLGYQAASSGNVAINDSIWESGRVFVGRSGTGEFNAVNGSTIIWQGSSEIAELENSTGTVSISDSNLEVFGNLLIGDEGVAEMGVFDGADVAVTGTATVGGAPGVLVLAGDATQLAADLINVGSEDMATLRVHAGAHLIGPGVIATSSTRNGRVRIDGPTSRWSALGEGEITLGSFSSGSGSAVLVVADGGRVDVHEITIRQQGEVVVTGAGSRITTTDDINARGGIFSLEDGVVLCDDMFVSQGGQASIDDGYLGIDGSLDIGPDSEMIIHGGAMDAVSAGISLLTVNDGRYSIFQSNTPGFGQASQIVQNGGRMEPGGSLVERSGLFAVLFDTDLILNGGIVHIEIGGVNSNDRIDSLGGDIVLGDVLLDVSLIAGKQLQDGEVFTIVSAFNDSVLTGEFVGAPNGARVGNFGGKDLFIRYFIDGNDDYFVQLYVPFTSPEIVPVEALQTFRGVNIGGNLNSIATSNDAYALYNPGFTLSPTEAPVWLTFDGQVLNGNVPTDIDFSMEVRASTPNLEHTIELFDAVNSEYVVIGAGEPTLVDAVYTASATGDLTRFIEPDGTIQARVGWRRTGFLIQFPWTISVDHAFWSVGF